MAIVGMTLTGCGSGTGQERNAATSKAASAVPADVTKAKEDLDLVVTALRNLRDASDTADLKMLFADLKTDRGLWLDAISTVLSSSANAVATGKEQITRWHTQADAFTDPSLREASSKREGDLRTAVDALATSRMSLVAESDTFNAQLNQVAQALDLDLSQTGAKSLKPSLSKAVDEEGGERSALTDVSAKSVAVTVQNAP
jgi:hypothetical protein